MTQVPRNPLRSLLIPALAFCLLVNAGAAPNGGEPGRIRFEPVGLIGAAGLRECSGLVASRTQPGVLWAHNDSGSPAEVYALSATGEHLATVPVPRALNRDWEDIAADDQGFLYLGDIGDNRGSKPLHTIYRIREPDISQLPINQADVEQRYVYTYDGEHLPDAEALFIHDGRIHILTKTLFGAPVLYRLEEAEGQFVRLMEARSRGSDLAMNAVPVTTLPVRMATGADTSLDGRKLAICSYGQAWVFELSEGGGLATLLRPRRIAYPGGHQIESITFDGDDLLLAAESRRMWRITAAQIEAETRFSD